LLCAANGSKTGGGDGTVQALIVDDDLLTCKLVKFILGDEGFTVTTASTAQAALAASENQQPDLFVIDVMMPHVDGFELCRRLRAAHRDAVIVFLTARAELESRVSGLDIGADDYLTKPFEPAELVARVKAAMRRYRRFQEAPYASNVKAGALELRVSELEVVNSQNGGTRVSLTPTEMKLLRRLMVSAGHVLSREALLDSIWGYGNASGDSQVIDVYIRRLRKKIEDDPSQPRFLESVRGSGYKFNAAAAAASAAAVAS
jgi:DNA-binding response OmpR family regulator